MEAQLISVGSDFGGSDLKPESPMYSYRPITARDSEHICTHRERMFLEAGHAQETLTPMTQQFRPWLEAQLEANAYFGRIASDGRSIIGSIGWMLLDWPPHPMHPMQRKRGYVLNLFVEPDHRRKGIAKALMADADTWFVGAGIEYCILHSTRMARTMYEKLGWRGTSEMARNY